MTPAVLAQAEALVRRRFVEVQRKRERLIRNTKRAMLSTDDDQERETLRLEWKKLKREHREAIGRENRRRVEVAQKVGAILRRIERQAIR